MNSYLLFKSLHLIAVVSWMVGLLYLPRIFVYHTKNSDNINTYNIFKKMEKKLYYYIMMPAMVLSWVFGFLLISTLGFTVLSELWMQTKLILIGLLTIYHFYLGMCVVRFANDLNSNSSKLYRIINEVPTILLIIIVFIVIFKPF